MKNEEDLSFKNIEDEIKFYEKQTLKDQIEINKDKEKIINELKVGGLGKEINNINNYKVTKLSLGNKILRKISNFFKYI